MGITTFPKVEEINMNTLLVAATFVVLLISSCEVDGFGPGTVGSRIKNKYSIKYVKGNYNIKRDELTLKRQLYTEACSHMCDYGTTYSICSQCKRVVRSIMRDMK